MDQRPDEATPRGGSVVGRSWARTIIAIVACAGMLAWSYKTTRDGMRPSTQWIRAIRSGDVDDRQIAARQLGDSGPGDVGLAIPALIAALDDEEEPVRAAASSGLGFAVVTALKAKVPGVDAKAVVHLLLRALGDEGPEARMAAASALGDVAGSSGPGEFPVDPPAVASALAGLLADPAAMVRKRGEIALFKLAAMGPLAPPTALVEGANGWPLAGSRATAALVLGSFRVAPGPSVQALTRALADREPEVRSNAAVALQRFGLDAVPALPALVEALADPFVPPPPPEYALTMGRPGTEERNVGRGNGGNALTDPATQAALAIGRIVAAQAGKANQPPGELLEALIRALHSPRRELRDAAEEALRQVGKGASAAIPSLIRGLAEAASSPEAGFGPAAAVVLGEIAPGSDRAGEVIEALTSALEAPAEGTRRAAVVALGRFGPTAAAALPRLKEVGQGASGDFAEEVRRASDRIEGKATPDSPRPKGQGRRGRGGPRP